VDSIASAMHMVNLPLLNPRPLAVCGDRSASQGRGAAGRRQLWARGVRCLQHRRHPRCVGASRGGPGTGWGRPQVQADQRGAVLAFHRLILSQALVVPASHLSVVNRGSGWFRSLSMWVLSGFVAMELPTVCLAPAPNPPLPRHASHWGSVYAHFLVPNAGHRTRTATGERGHGLGHYRAQSMKLCGASKAARWARPSRRIGRHSQLTPSLIQVSRARCTPSYRRASRSGARGGTQQARQLNTVTEESVGEPAAGA
jgi:hypothetical protein